MTDYLTMTEAVRTTGFSKARLKEMFKKAGISIDDGVPLDVINTIMFERDTYISFRDFAAAPRGENYNGSTSDKNKLLEKLELNNYYGIETLDPEELMIGQPKDVVFFRKDDIPLLENNLTYYFGQYALSEEDKVRRTLDATDRVTLRNCILKSC